MNKSTTALLLILCFALLASSCYFPENAATRKLRQLLESGNAAFRAKQYDRALSYYDAGLVIAPDEVTLLNNKTAALQMRGIEVYNSAIRLTDEPARNDGINAGKKDFTAASVVSAEAVRVLKNKSSLELSLLEAVENVKIQTYESRSESMRLLATIVDKTKADEALEATREYLSVETNPEKKLKTRLSAGKMLIDTLNWKKAVAEYKKVLEENPNHPDALFGMGTALAQSGQTDDFREAKSYFERFINAAPADHPSKAVAQEILDSMPKSK